ncbi:thiamine phosphate synthase [Arcobacter arenosus]|uniref:thiamine phosphate synthase n=1 Tax=Arcobacter arenosus TaxID=2576037 RepID=UPI003BAD50D5
MSIKLNGLYVISDDILTPKEILFEKIEEALKGGAKIVQLRDKKSLDEEIEQLVINLDALCKKYEALFILNDRINLAIKLQCSGLHVGKSDYEKIDYIRENFKGILGISCYGDLKTAKLMEEKGANYVAFGSFFASPTKPQAKVVSKEVLKEAKKLLNIPTCAIGGITLKNAKELLENDVDMLAVISDIWKSDSIENRCNQFSKLF